MLKFKALDFYRENIYDCAINAKTSEPCTESVAQELECKGSFVRANSTYETGLSNYHQVSVLLSEEEIKKIIEICDEAAKRTAGAIFAVSNEADLTIPTPTE